MPEIQAIPSASTRQRIRASRVKVLAIATSKKMLLHSCGPVVNHAFEGAGAISDTRTPPPRTKPVSILRTITRPIRMLLLAGLLLPLVACATPPTDPAARAEFEATNDPFEPTNRVIFEGNDFFYTYLVRPIAKAYVWTVPQFGRDRIHNFLQNLNEPVIWANDM